MNFKIACLVHRSLASLAPTYLTTDIHLIFEYGCHPLRSSTDRTLTVPRTHNRFGDKIFAVAGPRLWNSSPINLQQISSYGQFRRYLKNHLFGIWENHSAVWRMILCAIYIFLLTYLETKPATVMPALALLWTADNVVMWCGTAVGGGPHEERLIDDIIRNRNYTALARPVAEESEAVIVSFGLSLQQIIRVVCYLFVSLKLA